MITFYNATTTIVLNVAGVIHRSGVAAVDSVIVTAAILSAVLTRVAFHGTCEHYYQSMAGKKYCLHMVCSLVAPHAVLQNREDPPQTVSGALVVRDDTYVLNHCTAFLARTNKDRRHDFGFGHYTADDDRARFREAWRFPVIDTCSDDGTLPATDLNDVTFVLHAASTPAEAVSVVGTFGVLYQPQAMRKIEFLGEGTDYWATTVRVPRRGIYFYRFVVDGQLILDPINPQRQILENGVTWSRFFTWNCSHPVVLQRHELSILERLCDHILPFRTREGQRFLSWYYDGIDAAAREGVIRSAFRLDDSVGAANYIDKILAREESHHFIDYRKCLNQLDRILRQRDPLHEPGNASADLYRQIYGEMAIGSVNGWDTAEYGNPQYFLDLVRRHAFTGAFGHPKYGGNVSAAGWAYLKSHFPFEWERSVESPLGSSLTYRG